MIPMGNGNSNKKQKTAIESLISKRRIDKELWKNVKIKSNGSETDRLNAIEILFKNHYSLPKESTDLLKKLTSIEETQTIRLKIATSLEEKENEKIPYSLYSELIDVLRNDPEIKIRDIADKLYKDKIERLNDVWKIYSEANKKIIESIHSINYPIQTIQNQWLELAERIKKITIPRIDVSSAGLLQVANFGQQWNSIFSKQLLQSFPNYYSAQELQVVEKNLEIEKESIACTLKKKLKACLASDNDNKSKNKRESESKNDWKTYQDTCKDILSYSIVPPLLGPFEEASTESTGGTQRRDLIFNIPHDVGGFWQWVSIVHSSLSIIVECKNYGKYLPQNQVVITSKYLGRKRLGNLGIILTRKGLSKGAIAEQKRLWVEDEKLILCLTDEDLIKMLELKEHKEEPSKVIDEAVRSFRRSLA